MQNHSQRHSLSRKASLALALAGAAVLSTSCAAEDASASADGTAAEIPLASSTGQALFSAPEPWTKAVDDLPPSPSSGSIIGWLNDNGGWGTHKLHIDFSPVILHVSGDVPFRKFTPTEDFYSPDCDDVPFPVPPNGALEGNEGYKCEDDGDCHLLVVHEPSHKLYEMWRADMSGGEFNGGCVAVWDLDRSYTEGRGAGCTSADAGGFPVSAMVFTADEVASGSIEHAIRFVLPNSRIRRGVYVAPATHASDVLHGGPDAPPYGVRFRLRADFPLETLPTEGARVVARAMQRYGMLLADGGQVPLTAADDRFTEHKWSEVGVDEDSLTGIGVTDMEVVDLGEPVQTQDCERD